MIEFIVAMWLSFYPAPTPDLEAFSRRCGVCIHPK